MPSITYTEPEARIAWSVIAEPGDEHVAQFINANGDDPVAALAAVEALPETLRENVRDTFGLSLERWQARLNHERISATIRQVKQMGLTVLTPEDTPEVWLTTFADLHLAPHVLYVQGDVDLLAPFDRRIAIVGARACTGYGEQVTSELASEAARHGIPTVSGAAYGVDAVVHRATLANGGRTIAVLAGGLDRWYPSGNQGLLRTMLDRGNAVVAEVPPGTAPTRFRFLQRNRLIAAFGEGLVVTEAGFRSGSLHAATKALEQRRPFGAVPGSIFSTQSAGCHRLIEEFGARLITSWSDVEAMLVPTN